jgi:uncharacterized protein YqcC (DUF446 family)
MHDLPLRIAGLLLEIEADLSLGRKCEQKQPPMITLASRQPFCVDTLGLEQWLQWIFLPHMKQIIEQQQPLPSKSGIYAYAEEVLPGDQSDARHLLVLIKRFDDLIELHSAVVRH